LHHLLPKVPGELCVRFVGLLALCFAFTTNFLRPWATVNLITFALETGLLLRAMWLTWRVVSDRWRQKFFSERELALYTAHFEMHCLSKREFRALLDAGAEWRSWEPAEEGHGRHWTKLKGALTMEGKPTRSIMMITRGECVVVKGGVEVGRLGVGSLVGEMDFVLRLSDHMNSQEEQVPASASVIPSGDLSYVAWPKDKLAQHMAKSSYTKASVLTLIAAAQAGKLNATNERVKQRAEQLVMVQLQRCGDPGDESS